MERRIGLRGVKLSSPTTPTRQCCEVASSTLLTAALIPSWAFDGAHNESALEIDNGVADVVRQALIELRSFDHIRS
jgi:hypothetical protein